MSLKALVIVTQSFHLRQAQKQATPTKPPYQGTGPPTHSANLGAVFISIQQNRLLGFMVECADG